MTFGVKYYTISYYYLLILKVIAIDKNEKIIITLGVIVPFAMLMFFLDSIKVFFYEIHSVGLSVKNVVIYSLFTTLIILIILTIISEGGLLGEVQYLLGSFLLYFLFSFILIGYIW